MLARKAKNQYTWKGFGAIPGALQELKVILFLTLNCAQRYLVICLPRTYLLSRRVPALKIYSSEVGNDFQFLIVP